MHISLLMLLGMLEWSAKALAGSIVSRLMLHALQSARRLGQALHKIMHSGAGVNGMHLKLLRRAAAGGIRSAVSTRKWCTGIG